MPVQAHPSARHEPSSSLTIDDYVRTSSAIIERLMSAAVKTKTDFRIGVVLSFQESRLNHAFEIGKSVDLIADKPPRVEGNFYTAVKEARAALDLKLRACILNRRFYGTITLSVECDGGGLTVVCESEERLTLGDFTRKIA